MWPGFDSRTRRHMWVQFVVGSLLAPRGFSPGTPVFLPPPPPLPHQCGLGSIPGPGAICGFSLLLVLSLLREVFLRVLRFSPLLKNQHSLIPIRSGIRGPQVFETQACLVLPSILLMSKRFAFCPPNFRSDATPFSPLRLFKPKTGKNKYPMQSVPNVTIAKRNTLPFGAADACTVRPVWLTSGTTPDLSLKSFSL